MMNTRKEFESEAKKQGFSKHFKPFVSGSINYRNNVTQAAWQSWQACQALNDKRIAELEEKLKVAREALLYWRNECSGNEPSLSVFEIKVDEALEAIEG